MRAAIDTAVRHYGGLHVLHNNAGGSTPADNTVVEAPIEEFWRAIRLDLFGTFLGCRFGIPAIVASGGGSVINMASNVALMGVLVSIATRLRKAASLRLPDRWRWSLRLRRCVSTR